MTATEFAGRPIRMHAVRTPIGRDLYDGLRGWRLWTMLAWNDVRQRYRRSFLGPFWMTLSMSILVCALGFIYGHLFHAKIEDYLPFLTAGFILWGFISACLKESCQAFFEHESLIRQMKVPFSTYIFCVVWRNAIVLAHTIIILVPISLYFERWPQPVVIEAIPGLILLGANMVWAGLLLAILNTRFRDVSQIVETVLQIAIFATPIMWPASALGEYRVVAEINPIYHCIELVRGPLLGESPSALSWTMAVGILAVGSVLTMLLLRRVERRIVYWVEPKAVAVAFIAVQNLSVDIPIYEMSGVTIRKFLLSTAIGGKVAQQGSHLVVQALKNVSFEAHDGDRIGLIGQNGSGKTTLLRVLSGAYPPSEGTVDMLGRISPMLDNTLGMERDATGYENIRICGALRGLTRRQIEENRDDIAAFTELGHFLDMPVRSYSTGMQLRLAFAIATIKASDILLIDESIVVGDQHFLQKAEARIRGLVDRSRILIVASHSQAIIRQLCNKALWLHGGELRDYGDVDQVLDGYTRSNSALEPVG